MVKLPTFLSEYRCAGTHEVHSWSFGALHAVRAPSASTWQGTQKTLHDQAIFGPLRDHVCACGKYAGREYENMICDLCGVKLTTPTVRRSRFGHVNLLALIRHPFGSAGQEIAAFPILPAAFFQSLAGEPLAQAYDNLVIANQSAEHAEVKRAVGQVVEVLIPLVTIAHSWNLQDADILARGLALIRGRESPGSPERSA